MEELGGGGLGWAEHQGRLRVTAESGWGQCGHYVLEASI